MPKIGFSDGTANHQFKKFGFSDGTQNIPFKRLFVSDGTAWRKIFEAIKVGDIYSLGGYNWLVIDVNPLGQATLLCRTELAGLHYDGSNTGHWTSTNGLRVYLNSTIYNSFSAADKAKIITTQKTNWLDGPTNDNLWILSASELFGVGAVVNTYTLKNDGTQYPYFAGMTLNQVGAILGSNGHNFWLRSSRNSSYVFELYNTYVTPNYELSYLRGGNDSGGVYTVMACLINP